MVTRIYTPPVMSYYRAQQMKEQEEGASGQALGTAVPSLPEDKALQPSRKPSQDNAFGSAPAFRKLNASKQESQKQQKPLLASVQETQRISMGTILKDFKSTLNALGVDETTQQEVNAYLDVVAMQAQKDSPDAGFIRQSLKTAATTLDGYISKALQQPSNVVRDWVDALLLQPIDFHLDKNTADTIAKASTPNKSVLQSNPKAITTDSYTLDPTQLNTIKSLLQQSKAAYQAGDLTNAQSLLLNAKESLNGSDIPALQGRIALRLGKIAQDNHQYIEAKDYFQEAVNAFATLPNTSSRTTQSYLGLAQTEEILGQWGSAQQHYEQALIDTNIAPSSEIQARSGLGNSYLQQGLFSKAQEQFISAYQRTLEAPEHYQELPDILSNLGQVYEEQNHYSKAEKAYRLSLKYAKNNGNLDSYRGTLGQLSRLYEQKQNNTGYLQVLNRLETLSSET